MEVNCRTCNKPFTVSQVGQLYCRNACGAKNEDVQIAAINKANQLKRQEQNYHYFKQGRYNNMGASIPGGGSKRSKPVVAGSFAGLDMLQQPSVKSPLEIPQSAPALNTEIADFNKIFAQQTAAAIAQRQVQLQTMSDQQLVQAQASGLQTMQSQSPWDALGMIQPSVVKAPATPKKAIQISPRQPRERKIILED